MAPNNRLERPVRCAAAAGSALSGCDGRNRVDPVDLTELSARDAIAATVLGDIKAEDYARTLLDPADRLQALNAVRVLVPDAVLRPHKSLRLY